MTPKEIEDQEVTAAFIQGMKDRMVVSYFKYGRAADAPIDKIASLMKRLRMYTAGDETMGVAPGNTEYLMDVANFAMMEFTKPSHPDAHFTPTDDAGSPGRVAQRTGKLDKRANDALDT